MAMIGIRILADARDALRGFRQVQASAATTGEKIRGGFAKAQGPALAALGGIGAGLFKAAQSASELSDSISANQVILGKASGAVQAFADKAAASFGISKQTAIDAANAIGNFGSKAGLQGDQLASFTTSLLARAGDAASMFGGTATDAVEAFSSALRGEFEPARRYGVLLDENSVKAAALSYGLVKATGDTTKIKQAQIAATAAQARYNKAVEEHGAKSAEAKLAGDRLALAQTKLGAATAGVVPQLTAQQKTLAIQRVILEQTGKAQGDFARTSSSAKNQQEILKATIENATTSLGATFLPILAKGSKGLADFAGLAGRNQGAFKVLIGVIGGLAAVVVGVNTALKVGAAAQALWTGATKLATAVTNLNILAHVRSAAAWAASTAAVVAHTVTTKAAVLALKAISAAETIWAGATRLATAATNLNIVANVRAAATWVATKAAMIASSVATKAAAAGQWLLNAALNANPIGLIVAAIALLIGGFILAYRHSETFRRIVDAAFQGIKIAITAVINFLKGFFVAAFNFYKTAFTVAFTVIRTVVTAIFNGIRAYFVFIFNIYAAIFRWVVDQFRRAWAGITALYRVAVGVFNAIRGAVAAVFNWLLARFRQGIATLVAVWNGITGVYRKVIDFRNKIVGYLVGLAQDFINAGKNIMRGLIDGINAGFNWVRDKLKGLGGLIPDWLKGALGIHSPSTVMAGVGTQIIAGLTQGISGALPSLARQLGDVSDMVQTGISATAAVDLGNTPVGARAGAGTVINLTVAVPPTADKAAIGKEVVDALKAFQRQTGKVVLAGTP